MPHSLHQPDELTLVGGKLEMASGERPAEESEGSRALMKDGAEPRAGRVAVDDEDLVEIGHLEHGARGERALERLEGRLGVVVPLERVSAQEAR